MAVGARCVHHVDFRTAHSATSRNGFSHFSSRLSIPAVMAFFSIRTEISADPVTRPTGSAARAFSTPSASASSTSMRIAPMLSAKRAASNPPAFRTSGPGLQHASQTAAQRHFKNASEKPALGYGRSRENFPLVLQIPDRLPRGHDTVHIRIGQDASPLTKTVEKHGPAQPVRYRPRKEQTAARGSKLFMYRFPDVGHTPERQHAKGFRHVHPESVFPRKCAARVRPCR